MIWVLGLCCLVELRCLGGFDSGFRVWFMLFLLDGVFILYFRGGLVLDFVDLLVRVCLAWCLGF